MICLLGGAGPICPSLSSWHIQFDCARSICVCMRERTERRQKEIKVFPKCLFFFSLSTRYKVPPNISFPLLQFQFVLFPPFPFLGKTTPRENSSLLYGCKAIEPRSLSFIQISVESSSRFLFFFFLFVVIVDIRKPLQRFLFSLLFPLFCVATLLPSVHLSKMQLLSFCFRFLFSLCQTQC